jgi:hypothetical protein
MHSPRLAPHYPIWILLGCAAAVALYPTPINIITIWAFGAAFIILCLINPLWQISHFASVCRFEQTDQIGRIYKYGFIKPLRLSGRFLWLLIDHLLTEKIIIGGSISAAQTGLRFFRKIHSNRILGVCVIIVLLFVFLGLAYNYE